jgi:hypothetical protein
LLCEAASRNLIAGGGAKSDNRKMNRERLPTTDAGAPTQVILRLTRAQLAALDRFCAAEKLSRAA